MMVYEVTSSKDFWFGLTMVLIFGIPVSTAAIAIATVAIINALKQK